MRRDERGVWKGKRKLQVWWVVEYKQLWLTRGREPCLGKLDPECGSPRGKIGHSMLLSHWQARIKSAALSES